MNYEKSAEVLEEIKKANKILLNCHRGPDPDSIGSVLALYNYLVDIGKEVEIVCCSKYLYENIRALQGYDVIKKEVDFTNYNFSDFDLFIILDSSSMDQALGNVNANLNGVTTIVIDHHQANNITAKIKLVDEEITSTGELLFLIFEDWKVEITKIQADCLMTAIIGDTGAFRFPNLKAKSFRIIADLIDKGADKDKIIFWIYRNEEYGLLKFWGEILKRLEFDRENNIIWAIVPYEVFEEYGKPLEGKETSANQFLSIVNGSDFGFIGVEIEKNELALSFRSRNGFDTSVIARELGGGGHIYASGAKIKNTPLAEAVKKVLDVVRKYAKKTS